MTDQQFCYWLQGFAELSGDCPPTPEQWKSIREHLALCFKKMTPQVQSAQLPVQKPLSYEDLRKLYDRTDVNPLPPVTLTC